MNENLNIIAFESSCDETSVAVLENNRVISNIILSQEFHSKHGGVVPEIASREHLKKITGLAKEALKRADKGIDEINIVAATSEPGLIGALLIGMNFAKSLAATLNVPFIPVNHIQAHIYSSFLNKYKPDFPFISLIISGGHTLLVLVKDFFNHTILGTTVDDAAGEAFDKVAKMLGLGYPGGPEIDKRASTGDINFHKFPVSVIKDSEYNFSFSGIKTSVLYFIRKNEYVLFDETAKNNICASFQHSVVNSLLDKTLKAARKFGTTDISIAGGVSANSYVKKLFRDLEKKGFRIFIPDPLYSTDNAAMIGIAAYYKYKKSNKNYFLKESLKEKAKPKIDFGNF